MDENTTKHVFGGYWYSPSDKELKYSTRVNLKKSFILLAQFRKYEFIKPFNLIKIGKASH